MPVKAPPAMAVVAPVSSWEGFYLGADAGFGMGVTAFDQPFHGDFMGSQGFAGGLLAGYNHMLAPRWLFGVEADASWSDIEHREAFNDGVGDILTLKLGQEDAYSLRGRFGYLVTPTTLLYATGGWSWSHFNYSLNSNLDFYETQKLWLAGPQAGFGIETMVSAGWIARLEYLQAFYDSGTIDSTLGVRPTEGIGRFALIYRFGAGDAAPADAPSPRPSWNGLYVAGTLAAATGNAKIDSVEAPGNSINGIAASGVLPSLLAGYNWRVAPRWVIGVEGGAAPGISTADFKLDWTEALHGRFGYLLTPATLVYATAGWFGTGFRTTALIVDEVIVPSQRTNAAEIGAGVEAALDDHWAARFEYQYGIGETIRDITINFPQLSALISVHPQMQSAQFGLVYMIDGR
jgi:outer membrane immunogenic protein